MEAANSAASTELIVLYKKMPKKRIIEASIAQLTKNGSLVYPWVVKETLEVSFTPTFNTCYYGKKILEKIKTGPSKGNYRDIEDGEIYRIWQNKQ